MPRDGNQYLTRYRREVADLAGSGPSLTEAAKTTLVARMKEELPTDNLEFLISLGADPLARELTPTAGSPRG